MLGVLLCLIGLGVWALGLMDMQMQELPPLFGDGSRLRSDNVNPFLLWTGAGSAFVVTGTLLAFRALR